MGPAVLSRVYNDDVYNKREKAESEAQSGHALTKEKHYHLFQKNEVKLRRSLEAKRAWTKSISVTYSLTEKRPERIPITVFVPCHVCRVLLQMQPSRQNRWGR